MKKCDRKGFCVKIADFGLIAIHDFPEKSHTEDKWTTKYIAPEVRDSKKYDTKADVYSLGVIFKNLFDLQTDGYRYEYLTANISNSIFQIIWWQS